MKKRDIGRIEPRSEQLKLKSSQGRRDQQLCVLNICVKENLITYILFMLKIICRVFAINTIKKSSNKTF